jgi:pseudouridine-5'-phosphate glycosidase
MPTPEWLRVREEVRHALETNAPVVALESTLISHGLPWPTNIETALESERVIRERGATPATIAVLDGVPMVGLSREEIESLAQRPNVLKASRRDLAAAVFQRRTAATTVAATMHLAHRSGIRVFATGGIGGAHRGATDTRDVSADLTALARFPVAVISAGAKAVLDLPRTVGQ